MPGCTVAGCSQGPVLGSHCRVPGQEGGWDTELGAQGVTGLCWGEENGVFLGWFLGRECRS